MLKTITSLQGESVVVELPSNNGIKLDPDQEYIVVYTQDGTIILVPARKDPFTGNGKSRGSEQKKYKNDFQKNAVSSSLMGSGNTYA